MTPERKAYAEKRMAKLAAELEQLLAVPAPRPPHVTLAMRSKKQSLRRWRQELQS